MMAEAHCDAAIAPIRRLWSCLLPAVRPAHPDRATTIISTEMEALLARRTPCRATAEIMLHFALGKECEDLERHDRAFDTSRPAASCSAARLATIAPPRSPRSIRSFEPRAGLGSPACARQLCRRRADFRHRPATHRHDAGRTDHRQPQRDHIARRDQRLCGRASPRKPGEAGSSRSARISPDVISSPLLPSRRRQTGGSSTRRWRITCIAGSFMRRCRAAKIIMVQRHPLDACWAIYKAHFNGKFAVLV